MQSSRQDRIQLTEDNNLHDMNRRSKNRDCNNKSFDLGIVRLKRLFEG